MPGSSSVASAMTTSQSGINLISVLINLAEIISGVCVLSATYIYLYNGVITFYQFPGFALERVAANDRKAGLSLSLHGAIKVENGCGFTHGHDAAVMAM